jgi:TldD protein
MSFSSFTPAGEYSEFRQHELKTRRLAMIDGNLMANDSSHRGGQSARAYCGGYWGFASANKPVGADKLGNIALANAKAMKLFGGESRPLPSEAYRGEHCVACEPNWSSEQLIDWLESVTGMIQSRYQHIASVTAVAMDEYHHKYVQNSLDARVYNNIARAMVILVLTAKDKDDKPVELMQFISGKGSFGNLDLSMASVEPQLDTLYEHLMAKREAVHAKGGLQTVVLAPDLAGILAHEAMGHPCEADLVLGVP